MAGQPIIPRSITNPIGESARIDRTISAIEDGLDAVSAWLIPAFEQIPTKAILVNSLFVNKYRYEYQISIPDLEEIVRQLQLQLDSLPNDYVDQQVRGAYEIGTNNAVVNLANISDDYTRNITQVLISEPYQRRVALVSARVFEEMKGFEDSAGVDLSRILRSAVQDGLNPTDVTKQLMDRFDISKRRAQTIARTEITGALRRGRWDEAQDAQERLGIKTKLIWVSALSPTTRLWHAKRHGDLYTIQQVREFYAVDGNSINCKCSQSEVLVDDNGEAVTPRVVLRLKKQKAEYFDEAA